MFCKSIEVVSACFEVVPSLQQFITALRRGRDPFLWYASFIALEL